MLEPIISTNVINIILSKLCLSVSFSALKGFFNDRICNIVGLRSKEKVFRIHAKSVVASMANNSAVIRYGVWYAAFVYQVRNSVRRSNFAFIPNLSVPFPVFRSVPYPATAFV